MTLAPTDKAALLLYWRAVHETIQQGTLPPKTVLEMIQHGLKMTHDAYQGVTCLQCGMPWADHPANVEGEIFCRVFTGRSPIEVRT